MAKFNELQVGRFNRFLQKLLSMKGPASMSQLASELQPVIPMFSGVENRYLETWNRFGLSGTAPTQAAAQSAVRLRNPTGTNVLAVIEKIVVTETAIAGGLSFGLTNGATNADLNTLVNATAARFDPRGQPQPSCIMSQSAAGGAPTALQNSNSQYTVLQNSSVDLILFEDQEIPLLPGDALQLVGSNNNNAIITAWWWRERFLEDSERT